MPQPHDPYITAVCDALTAANIPVADGRTSDSETRGTYCYLNAVITLDPDTTGLDEDDWPEGLLVIWEWHTGLEQGEPERGPSWQRAKKNRDGSNSQPELLPIDGFANPAQLAAAVHELVTTGKAIKPRPGRWDGTASLEAACEKWASNEEVTA